MRIKNQEPLLYYVKDKEERCFKANSSEKPKAMVKQISEEAAESSLQLGKPDMAKEAVRLAQDKDFLPK